MAEGRIDSAIAVDLIKKEVADVDAALDQFEKKIENFPKIRSLFEGADNFKKLNAAQNELSTSGDQLNKINAQIEAGEKKLIALRSEQAKQLTEIKLATREITKDQQQRIKLQQSEEGSIEQLGLKLDKARGIYDKLGEAQRNSSRGQELLGFIKQTSQAFDAQKASTDRFQQRVGNYVGSAKIIVDAFERSRIKLEQVDRQFGQASPEAKAARQEFEQLDRITSSPQFLNISAKLGDTRGEIGFLTRQLIAMREAGLGSSDSSKELGERLSVLTKELRETREEAKALSSEHRSFDLFASSVTLAARSAETFVGVQGLIGQKDEDVERGIQKIVAIQSVANGLQEISRQVTEKGTAANKLYGFVQAQVAVLTNASASATQKFSAVLKLSPIGIIVGLLGIAASAMGLFGGSTKKAKEEVEFFNLAIEQSNTDLSDNIKNIQFRNRLTIENAKQRGASEKEISQLVIQGYRDEAKAYREGAADKVNTTINTIKKIAPGALKLLPDFDFSTLKKAQESYEKLKVARLQFESFGKINPVVKEQMDALIETGGQVVNSFQQATDADRQGSQELAQLQTKLAQDARQIALENARAEITTAKDKNDVILSDERSTLSEKIKALTSNLQLEHRLIEAERRSSSQGSDVERATARQKANQQISTANVKFNQEIFKLNDSFRIRDLTAEHSVLEAKLQIRIAANQKILDNENKSVFQRSAALGASFNDQKKIIESQKNLELQALGLTAKERVTIEQKADAAVEAARVDMFEKLKSLVLQSDQTHASRELSKIEQEKDEELLILSKKFGAGKISEEKYNKDRLDIEQAFSVRSLSKQLDYAEKFIKLLKVLGINTVEQEKLIAALRLQIQDGQNAQAITSHQKTLNALAEISKRYNQVADVIGGALDAAATRRKNQIQDQIDSIDTLSQKEIDAINNSVLAEDAKQQKIAFIQKNAAAKKAELEKQQKQIDRQRAIFDKANAIFNIVLSTATAIAQDIKTPWKIAFDAAIGAAQLAIAVAAPLPHFKKGKKGDDPYSGPGVVGDAGREFVITRTGDVSLFSKPTLTHLVKGDVVLPNSITESILASMSLSRMIGNSRIPQENKETSNDEIVRQLKELNKKSGIHIHVKDGWETTANYDYHMKH
jgi:hypothetical protein